MERKYIYKMSIDCGRQGELESTFIATPSNEKISGAKYDELLTEKR